MRYLLVGFLLVAGLLVRAQQAPLYFPPIVGDNWETISPDSLGFCPEAIDSLYSFLGETGTKSFMLLQDGKIVLEKYFGTYTRDSFWYWASAGKSLTAFLVGQAKQEGLVHLDSATSTYLGTGWTSCSPEQEQLITVRHQLSMSTGLDDGVLDDNCTDPGCLHYLAAPGTRWAYHNAPYHLLHDVLEQATGWSLQQFTKNRLLDKTGMRGLWINHVQYGRARDMARFGLLMLAKGSWNGISLLSDSLYYQAMIQPSQSMNPSYGYLWWLNSGSTYLVPGVQLPFVGPLFPAAPLDLYAALGKNDQKIHVVPSKNWVVVRQGTGSNLSLVPIVFDQQLWLRLLELDCGASGVKANEQEDVVEIFPTVAGSGWWLESASELAGLRLWSGEGKVLWSAQQPMGRVHFVEVKNWPHGWYLMEVQLLNGRRVLKRVGIGK
jgi:CubicO group peptidase (beta-lactamase class C family)